MQFRVDSMKQTKITKYSFYRTYSLGNRYSIPIYDSSNISPQLSSYTILTDPEFTSTTLFKDKLILRNSGNFTVEAVNEYGNDNITFTLLVRSNTLQYSFF